VIRLYPEEDFLRRPAQDAPEITRRELAQLVLDLEAMGVRDLAFLDPPLAVAMDAARALLARLGAIDSSGITPLGRRMARLPLHPRIARLLLACEDRGVAETGCRIAAALSTGERLPEVARHKGPSDLLELAERDWMPQTRRTFDQLKRFAPARDRTRDDAAALLAVVEAFPDRIAKRRKGSDLLLASGGSAQLANNSVVQAELLVCVDAEERRDRGLPLVRLASAVEPEWLLEVFPDRISERRVLEWSRTAERVEQVSAVLFDSISLEEVRQPATPDPECAAWLAKKAIEAGIERFVDREQLDSLMGRLQFAAERGAARPVDREHLETVLAELCEGRRSFAELRDADLLVELRTRFAGGRFEDVAPERIKLSKGRAVKVHYEPGKPPWMESRLQDFFGMKETPRVGGVAVVIHLLAPNQRPVQTTSDLGGFWQRLYPQVRKELMRRYPKHAWPEQPL
jgi:ATP-dependent helicase HrpB